MEKAYLYEFVPTREQRTLIIKTFGCKRYVMNHFIARIRDKEDDFYFNKYKASKEITAMKKEKEWLKEPDSTALQAAMEDLEKACENWRNGSGKPHFKCRSHRQTYRSKNNNNSIRFNSNGKVQIPKAGELKVFNNGYRPEGRILSATIIMEKDGRFFLALSCTDVEIEELPKTGKAVGVDLGLKTLAVTSDGQCFENQKALAHHEEKIKKLQRRLSRRKKGSVRWEKARLALAKEHRRAANCRKDTIRKATTDLIQNYDIIFIEDLHVKNMMKNNRLSKAIGDAAWHEFRRQLLYKARWYGKTIEIIGPFFPSTQLCSVCGEKNPNAKDLSIRVWECEHCHTIHDRDQNAAQNLLIEGLRIITAGTAE